MLRAGVSGGNQAKAHRASDRVPPIWIRSQAEHTVVFDPLLCCYGVSIGIQGSRESKGRLDRLVHAALDGPVREF